MPDIIYNINDRNTKVIVANFFTNILSIKDIEELLNESGKIDLFSKREITKTKVVIFDSNFGKAKDRIIINDVLNLDKFPVQRYLELIINRKSNEYKIKIKYDKNLYSNLIEIMCRSYNIIRYKSNNKDIYSVSNNIILSNYARSVASLLLMDNNSNQSTIDDLKYISNGLFFRYKIMRDKDLYFKTFKINNDVNIEISSVTNSVMKLQINVKGQRRLIYLNKSIIGIHNISLIINKINKYYKASKNRRK